MYQAWAGTPDNEQVKRSLMSGMPGCAVLDPRTPRDANIYFVESGNSLNTLASGKSIVDGYMKADELETAWRADRQKERGERAASEDKSPDIKRSQAGEETLYWQFCKLHAPSWWGSFAELDACKAFKNGMREVGLME
eukprot:3854319-Alexandrium_andersonii.AAC.1